MGTTGCETIRCQFWNGSNCTHEGDICIHRIDDLSYQTGLSEGRKQGLMEAVEIHKRWMETCEIYSGGFKEAIEAAMKEDK